MWTLYNTYVSKYQKIIDLIGLMIAVIWAVVLFWPQNPANSLLKTVKINNKELHVYLAKSQEEWQQGLSGVSGLAQDGGMLFIFNEPGFYYMWMKDMKFPIDIIWISDNFKIVDYKENARPEGYPKEKFGPKELARYALEVNAGWILKNNIEIGQKIVYNEN